MTPLDKGLYDTVSAAFAQEFGSAPDLVARAPGRVNLIGEHTDYNDGFVLPCAIGPSTMVAASRRDDNAVHIVAVDFDNAVDAFDLKQPIERNADQPWADSVTMECCRLTLSWFIALVCGSRRTQRNTHLKVAGFHSPIPGWF